MRRLLSGLAAAAALAACAPKPDLPRLGAAPDFQATAVTTRSSEGFDGAAMAGRPWIVDFIFTSCPGPCPAVSAQMAGLQARLPKSVGLLSFTVDPRRDTPAVLSAYAGRFKADPDRWRFLRLAPEALPAVVSSGFKLGLEARGGSVTHSTKLVLVDAERQIRGYYDYDDPAAVARLEADAASLASAR